jgi:hypothetical protein
MSRATVYANRGRTPRNCYTCDGVYACRCDKITLRAAKRGAKATWSRQVADESAPCCNMISSGHAPRCDEHD